MKKRTSVQFSLDRAITRIQEVHDFYCQFVKAFLGTTANTQDSPQDVVSSIVLENEKKILQSLKKRRIAEVNMLHSFLRYSKLVERFDTDCQELPLGEESWIIRYAIEAPV